MTNQKIKISLRVLEILMQCMIFITLSVIFSFSLLKYNVSEYNRCLMISTLVIATYLFRKFINGFFTFYFLHFLLIVAAIFYARSTNECFVYFLLVGILLIFSGHIKITTTKVSVEKMPVQGMAIMVICYMYGMYINNAVMIQSGLLILVLFTMAEIVYNNLDKINNVFIENKENVNFPANQLFKVNMDMLITALIIVFAGMMAFYSTPYGNTFQIIGRFFHWIIGLIIGLLFRKPQENIQIQTEAITMETSEHTTESYFTPTDSGSFDQLFYSLLIMLLIFITIVLIIKIVSDVKRFAKKKKRGSDLIEFIKPKKNAMDKIKISRVKRLNEASELDHNLKLRKIYKKKVKKGIGKEKISSNEFPEDITRKGISENAKDIKIVTDIYEKARYSNEKVNSEEIEIIKNINNK